MSLEKSKFATQEAWGHKKFLDTLDERVPYRSYHIRGEYKGSHEPILVETEFGLCRVKPYGLLSGATPSIKTALDPTDFLRRKFKKLIDAPYDFSKYVYGGDNKTKSTVICPSHGEFQMTPNMLLSGNGCSQCAMERIKKKLTKTTEEFILESKEIHKDVYDYGLVEYVNARKTVVIKCHTHGTFKRTPDEHLRGKGCPKCSHRSRQNYHTKEGDSALYIIECQDKNENFLKIGVTKNTVEKRFKDKYSMPYSYQILRLFHHKDSKVLYDIEQELLSLTKSAFYQAQQFFDGYTECRLLSIKTQLLEYFDVCENKQNYLTMMEFVENNNGFFDRSFELNPELSKATKKGIQEGWMIHRQMQFNNLLKNATQRMA